MSKPYEVGHGKPPKHSQWTKGQSGNLSGRPKGKKQSMPLLDHIAEVLSEEIELKINGKLQKMSLGEAFAKSLLRDALTAPPKTKLDILDKLAKLGVLSNQNTMIEEQQSEAEVTVTEYQKRLFYIAREASEADWD